MEDVSETSRGYPSGYKLRRRGGATGSEREMWKSLPWRSILYPLYHNMRGACQRPAVGRSTNSAIHSKLPSSVCIFQVLVCTYLASSTGTLASCNCYPKKQSRAGACWSPKRLHISVIVPPFVLKDRARARARVVIPFVGRRALNTECL